MTTNRAARRAAPLNRLLLSSAAASCLAAALPAAAQTLPTDPTTAGTATTSRFDVGTNAGFGLRVDLRDANQVIDWRTFNVGTPTSSIEQVDFTTASASPFAVLNRVAVGNPSGIFGQITSKTNVTVWLVNPSGVTFGATGGFSGGGLVLSTAALNGGIDADFVAGNNPLALTGHAGGAAGIVLAAGTGALAAAGPIVLIAQNIDAAKTMTSSSGDVALVTATDVVVPNAFGSPLGIAITRGTTLATARVDATGAITGANVRLVGARESDITAALLNIGPDAVLTATAAGGKVVLAAGAAPAGSDLTLSGATGGVADIAVAGTLRATGAVADILVATNGAVTGGGDIAAAGGITVTVGGTGAVMLGDIAAADSFALDTTGAITTGAITITGGGVTLANDGGPATITTGVIAARDAVTIAATGDAVIERATAGTGTDLTIDAAGDVTLGRGAAGQDILLTSSAGDVAVTGALLAGRNVGVEAFGAATLAGDTAATTGDYTVEADAITLGSADTPATQRAAGFVRAIADVGAVRGLGALSLQSNSGGADDAGNARYVQIEGATGIDFAPATTLLGGTAGQSLLALGTTGPITLGTVSARALVPADDFAAPQFTAASDFTATALTVADALTLASTAGSIRLGSATSTTGGIALSALAGDITGLAIAAGFGAADLRALTADATIAVEALGNAQLGTLTAGSGVTTLDGDQIAVTAGALSVTRAVAANGDARLIASGGGAALASADIRGNLTAEASEAAAVTGNVVTGGFYAVRGAQVTLGDSNGAVIAQRAAGYVDIAASAGAITGAPGLTLQSNAAGAADPLDAAYLQLSATGDIAFAADSALLGGTAGQSLLALTSGGSIALGTAQARRIVAAGDFAATRFGATGTFIATAITVGETLDLTAGAIQLGSVTSQTGNIALTTTAGDLVGLLDPVTLTFGRASLTTAAAASTITVDAAGLARLGTVSAGTGTTPSAGDQIAVVAASVDALSMTAANGGLRLTSRLGDVWLENGSARSAAAIDSASNVRLGGLTSIAGAIEVLARRDVSGFALPLAAPSEVLLARFGRADLTAAGADQSISVIAGGGVQARTVRAGRDIAIEAAAIDAVTVAATTGSFALVTQPGIGAISPGIALGTGTAAIDGTIAASGDVRLGTATVGRDLTIAAGTPGTPGEAATIAGNITAGRDYRITASRIALGGETQAAGGAVDLYAYGTAATDGIVGTGSLTLIANRDNGAGAAPLTLRADGGAGIAFAPTTILLGGGNGISADIGIIAPLSSLALGNVRARSLQGLASGADFGTPAMPNPVAVTGSVDLRGPVTLTGALAIASSAGDIATGAITTGGGLLLSATTGTITAAGPLRARGDVALDALGTVRLASLVTDAGSIAVTSRSGDVTGLTDILQPLAPFAIGTLVSTGGGVDLALPDNAAIDSVTALGDITVGGGSVRLGSATSTTGDIAIVAAGALTGTAAPFVGVGQVSASLNASGSIDVVAGTGGAARAINLRDVTAGVDVSLTADRIAVAEARAGAALSISAGSTLAIGSGIAGALERISGTGDALAPEPTPDFARALLATGFGRTDLTVLADDATIDAQVATIAQLGTVTAGTAARAAATDQIRIDAGALTATTLIARGGGILASATRPVGAAGVGSPLLIGTIASANRVGLVKTGDNGLATDQLTVDALRSGTAGGAAIGDVVIASATDARLGTVDAVNGAVSITTGDALTGTAIAASRAITLRAGGNVAATALTAGTAIDGVAGGSLDAGTLSAGTDIDLIASGNAAITGNATANAGRYRVTGTSVSLGAGGGAAQSAATTVAIRSTAGDITGGSGLTLTSDSGGAGAATSQLVLDSARGILFADGIGGGAVSSLRAGSPASATPTRYTADIGIRVGAGAPLQLGSVAARSIGSASVAGTGYTIAPTLATTGAIGARDIVVDRDLLVTGGGGITLDSAVSQRGAIDLAATGALTGRGRVDLTAALGVTTASGSAVLGSVVAGGAVRLTTSAAALDAVAIRAGGSATLRSATDLRLGSVTAGGEAISVTAGGDVTGQGGANGFGRADLTAGASAASRIEVTATGAVQLGTVAAGLAGSTTTTDQLVASGRSVDITSAAAANGNLALTAIGGDVVLGTGAAQAGATIRAAASTRIGTLRAQAGNIAVTATAGDIAGVTATGAVFETRTAARTIALTADRGTATLGTVDTVDGDITLTAADAVLGGDLNADSATLRVLRGSGSGETRLGTLAATTGPALRLDEAEFGRLKGDVVQIGARVAQAPGTADISVGKLAIAADTGDRKLQLLGSGVIALTGAISDAGADVGRVLQVGGTDTALPNGPLGPTALAGRIRAVLAPGNAGASIDLPQATVDLRAQRIDFGTAGFIAKVDTASGGATDAATAQRIADDFVTNAASDLYRNFAPGNAASPDVYLAARLLQVSYSGFALFQNTGTASDGRGVALGIAGNSVAAPTVLELRSAGEAPTNAFGLFGTINGFVGRTAGLLPDAVVSFADAAGADRVLRITQANSRVNGCVIGSPDRGCLVTEVLPPALRIFDQRQLELFQVAEDLTIAFEPSVGNSNEALIGDFTTTGGLIAPDCTVPGAPGCPPQGEVP